MKLFSPGTKGLKRCRFHPVFLCWRGAESTCPLLRQTPLVVLRVALALWPQLAPLCAALACAFARYPKLCARCGRRLAVPRGETRHQVQELRTALPQPPQLGFGLQTFLSSISSPHSGAPSWLRERASWPAVGIAAAALQTTTLQGPKAPLRRMDA